MYADDTSLCYQSSDINVLNEAINNDLKQLDTWLQGNKLSLNVAKTNSMLVSTKQKHNILKSRNEDLDLKIRDNELEIIQKNKYLRVQIDNSLNWKEDIKTVSSKVSRAIGFLGLIYKLKRCGVSGQFLLLIQSFLEDRKQRTVLNGQSSIWGDIFSRGASGLYSGTSVFPSVHK